MLKSRVKNMVCICLHFFWLFCRWGFRCAFFSLHTLTLYFVHDTSGALYLGMSSLELEGIL